MDKKIFVGLIFCGLILSHWACAATVDRDLPSSVKKGATMVVTLDVDVDESDLPNSLGLSEELPSGVTVTSASSSGVIFDDKTEWLFLKQSLLTEVMSYLSSITLEAVADKTVTYNVKVPKDYAGSSITFDGAYMDGTSSGSIGGDLTVPVIGINGDANDDGVVNYSDLIILASAYNSEEGDASYAAAADYNGDGKIDYNDLLVLAENYTAA